MIARAFFNVTKAGWAADATRWATAHGDRANVYIGNALRRREGGRDSDVLESWMLSGDFDFDPGLEKLAAFSFEPTLIVATGGRTKESGQPRVHAHWSLSEPISPEQIRDFQYRLRDHLDGDPKRHPTPGAVWRLPSTMNTKNGELAELTTDRDVRYSPAVFEEHLPARRTRRRGIAVPNRDRDHASRTVGIERAREIAMSEISAGGSRNVAGFGLACTLRDLGLSERDRESILIQFREEVSERFPRDHPYDEREILASNRQASKRPPRGAAPPGLRAWGRRAVAAAQERHPQSRTLVPLILRMIELAELRGTAEIAHSERAWAEDVQRNAKRIRPALKRLNDLGLIRRTVGPRSQATRCTLLTSKRDRREDRREHGANTGNSFFCSVAPPLSAPIPLSHDAQAHDALGQAFPTLYALSSAESPLAVCEIAARSNIDPRDVSRHLARSAEVGIVRQLADRRWVLDAEQLGEKLDAAAERFKTNGQADRLRARHAKQRRAFAESRAKAERERHERVVALISRLRPRSSKRECRRERRRSLSSAPIHAP